MPQTEYRVQMQFKVTADPVQTFTLTEQDTTITTQQVTVSINIMGPRRRDKPPHCDVFFHAFGVETAADGTVIDPERKVAGNTVRALPDEVVAVLRQVAPQAVQDALAERPQKTR